MYSLHNLLLKSSILLSLAFKCQSASKICLCTLKKGRVYFIFVCLFAEITSNKTNMDQNVLTRLYKRKLKMQYVQTNMEQIVSIALIYYWVAVFCYHWISSFKVQDQKYMLMFSAWIRQHIPTCFLHQFNEYAHIVVYLLRFSQITLLTKHHYENWFPWCLLIERIP